MSILLLQGLAVCVALWVLWKYFRQIVVKSPLDNIPGPPTGSLLYGKFVLFLESYWQPHILIVTT